jgi:hypothetical protein
MALFNNGLKGNLATGLAIGIGAAILGPILVPVVASIVKPLAKAAIKGGVLLYEKGREVAAETGEVVEDLVAEARSELNQRHQEAVSPSAGKPAGEEHV